MMSSTLVETVSINYEDFNDSFLTCGTCLCVYDGQERTPKLLPCSHTVCRACLERIVAAQTLGKQGSKLPVALTLASKYFY
jgi:tripartite motif-containing protein 2/3